jgi:hypothetical protein
MEVAIKGKNRVTYISLTDIAKLKNPSDPRFVVINWMRSKETIALLGLWEIINNPDFNRVEFDTVRDKEAGYNAFSISPSQWIERTNAIGIISSAGRHGSGTFAHPDLAFEFASWVSVEFKLYLIKEFQRLKESEQKALEWSAKRELARLNYHIQTDAIKENLILPALTQAQKNYVYADEADLLNVALFGKTAKEWRSEHPDDKGNIRDYATLRQLLVLANMESHNAAFITEGLAQGERLTRLRGIAERELRVLTEHSADSTLLLAAKETE